MSNDCKCEIAGAAQGVPRFLNKGLRAYAEDRRQKPQNGRVLPGESESFSMVRRERRLAE